MTVTCITCGREIINDREHNKAYGVEPYPYDWDQGVCAKCDREARKSEKITPEKRLELLRHAASGAATFIDGTLVDATTAGWLCQLYDALGEANRQKFIGSKVTRMANIMYQLEERGTIQLGFK
jgi:hypothetical protein